jgi:ethanolamine transporter EutH
MPRTLDEQRREFAQRRGLAMPLAGAVAWTIVGVGGAFLPPIIEVWLLFGATGFIVGLGIFFSRFTGENFLDKQRPKNVFDGLFFRTVGEALLVYAIAIPFFREDYTSLPLSVGILSGLMWLPFSWIIGHWVGTFHTLARTALVTASWYLFPHFRFIAVPAVIVAIYAVTIVVLEARWRRIHAPNTALEPFTKNVEG